MGGLSLYPMSPCRALDSRNPQGTITSNMAIVSTGNGSINVFASNPTYLSLDNFGYFAP